MNFRITTLFFALLLTMLWVFGLMIAHKKSAGDQTLIMPTLGGPDVKIDKVIVKRSGEKSFDAEFEFDDGSGFWFLKAGKQRVRVEGFKIDNLIKQIRTAKHDETADVNKDASVFGLDKPRAQITLEGIAKIDGERKTWQFDVGNASAGLAYVKGSDRKDKVFAVARQNLEPLLFKDPNHLRSKRLFDFGETNATKIDAKKDGKELEIKRNDATHWTFLKPKFGPAGTEAEPEPKKKNPFQKETDPVGGGVKGLLASISDLQVDNDGDFEPLGNSLEQYGLEPGKESMRIQVSSTNDKDKVTKETLYVGARVKGKGDYYFARLDSDDGVFKIAGHRLASIAKAIEDPGKLRSLDIVVFDKKLADAIVIKQGKEDFKFFKSESEGPRFPDHPPIRESWEMVAGGEMKKANDNMINALIEQILGKKAIVQFEDGTEDELKKKDAGWGLDAPLAEISVYLNGAEKAKPAEKKDEAKKGEAKKDETKKEPTFALKKDAAPEVTLAIGKTDGDFVYIRRTLKDGSVTRFTVKKDFAEKILPAEGVELAYLDTSLPAFSPFDVVSAKLHRVTDKGPESIELMRRYKDGRERWFMKDALEPTGSKPADENKVRMLFDDFQRPVNKKWLKKIGKDDNLDKFGLKTPAAALTLTIKKHETNTKTLAAIIGVLACDDPVAGAALAVAGYEADPGEVITLEFGKETDNAKDKPGVFAKQSGNSLLFLAQPRTLKFLKEIDLRDRSSTLYTQVELVALTWGAAAINPVDSLMFLSPYFTGTIHEIDPEKVTKIRLAARSPYEFRTFEFDRKEKEKAKELEKAKDDKAKDKEPEKDKESRWTWTDKSGLQEFQLDPDKVAQLVKDFAKLRTDRFVAVAGSTRGEYKLDPKDATVKLDLTTEDGKTVTLLIGAGFEQHGYFAKSTVWPEVVFFVPREPRDLVGPLLDGTRHFAKPRSAAE